MTRKEILDKADACINGGRDEDYGKPEDNFKAIARLWSVYLDRDITPLDVAMMMALLKIARVMVGGSLDCFVDLAGYAACGGEIWVGRERTEREAKEETVGENRAMLSEEEVAELLRRVNEGGES